jgi:hypothetical protein
MSVQVAAAAGRAHDGAWRSFHISDLAPPPMSAPPAQINGFSLDEHHENGYEEAAEEDAMAVLRHERHGFAEEYQSEAYMRELESECPESFSAQACMLIVVLQASGFCIGPMYVLSPP